MWVNLTFFEQPRWCWVQNTGFLSGAFLMIFTISFIDVGRSMLSMFDGWDEEVFTVSCEMSAFVLLLMVAILPVKKSAKLLASPSDVMVVFVCSLFVAALMSP